MVDTVEAMGMGVLIATVEVYSFKLFSQLELPFVEWLSCITVIDIAADLSCDFLFL